MCFQGLKVKKVPTVYIHDSEVQKKFTKLQIRVPSKSRIRVESESSIDEDNIFVISPPIIKGMS